MPRAGQFSFRARIALLAALLLTSTAGAIADSAEELPVAARTLLGAGQGVYAEASDGTVLVAQHAARAVHPASLSKIPTTLALLRALGPDYRFATRFESSGPVSDGALQGDLLVTGAGDPFFVDENALLVAATLNRSGINRVTGTLRVAGPLTFNWQGDPDGSRLRAALSGHTPPLAWSTVQAAFPDLAAAGDPLTPVLEFMHTGGAAGAPSAAQPLLVHYSQPLWQLVKALNDYSNNIFAPLAAAAGGAASVQQVARAVVPAALRNEITLGDGAGMDPANRLSPRAVVRLLRVLEADLGRSGHTLTDILPVSGIDAGTLHERLNGPDEAGCVVGKTGTFGDYGASALAGAIHTSDRGTVYFAILNRGVPVPAARRRQDAFVRALLASLKASPWNYQRDDRPAVALAEVVPAPVPR